MNKTIKLANPFDAHGKRISELQLKEPTGATFIKLGEPRILVFNATGSGYYVEQAEVVEKYIEACLVHELGNFVLTLLSLEDTIALKEELFSFFVEAAQRRAATKSTP